MDGDFYFCSTRAFEGENPVKIFEDADLLEQLVEKADRFGRLIAKISFDYEGQYEPARSIRSAGNEVAQALREGLAALAEVQRVGFAELASALRERRDA